MKKILLAMGALLGLTAVSLTYAGHAETINVDGIDFRIEYYGTRPSIDGMSEIGEVRYAVGGTKMYFGSEEYNPNVTGYDLVTIPGDETCDASTDFSDAVTNTHIRIHGVEYAGYDFCYRIRMNDNSVHYVPFEHYYGDYSETEPFHVPKFSARIATPNDLTFWGASRQGDWILSTPDIKVKKTWIDGVEVDWITYVNIKTESYNGKHIKLLVESQIDATVAVIGGVIEGIDKSPPVITVNGLPNIMNGMDYIAEFTFDVEVNEDYEWIKYALVPIYSDSYPHKWCQHVPESDYQDYTGPVTRSPQTMQDNSLYDYRLCVKARDKTGFIGYREHKKFGTMYQSFGEITMSVYYGTNKLMIESEHGYYKKWKIGTIDENQSCDGPDTPMRDVVETERTSRFIPETETFYADRGTICVVIYNDNGVQSTFKYTHVDENGNTNEENNNADNSNESSETEESTSNDIAITPENSPLSFAREMPLEDATSVMYVGFEDLEEAQDFQKSSVAGGEVVKVGNEYTIVAPLQ